MDQDPDEDDTEEFTLDNEMFLVRFQDGCEKDVTSNKLTVVTVEKSPVDK